MNRKLATLGVVTKKLTKIICVILQRNGADFCVFVNTANEFDGSDSGARPDEAVSWGKIKMDADPVKVCTRVLPKCG